MGKRIELIFKNELGRNVTLALDNPVEPVNQVLVAQVMDQVIATNVFVSPGGPLVGKHGARIVENTVTEIEL